MHFAREGADVAILYLNEHDDAKETEALVQREGGRKCLLFAGDVGDEKVGAVALSLCSRRACAGRTACIQHTHTHSQTHTTPHQHHQHHNINPPN